MYSPTDTNAAITQQALARCSRPSAPTQRTSVGTGTTHKPTGGGAMYFVHWPKLRDDSRWRNVLRLTLEQHISRSWCQLDKGLPRLRRLATTVWLLKPASQDLAHRNHQILLKLRAKSLLTKMAIARLCTLTLPPTGTLLDCAFHTAALCSSLLFASLRGSGGVRSRSPFPPLLWPQLKMTSDVVATQPPCSAVQKSIRAAHRRGYNSLR